MHIGNRKKLPRPGEGGKRDFFVNAMFGNHQTWDRSELSAGDVTPPYRL